LQKVVAALKVDIAEIWPPSWNAEAGIALTGLKEVDRINWFRMREVYLRSNAESLCLVLSHSDSLRFLGWINLSDSERYALKNRLTSASSRLQEDGWQVFRRAGKSSVLTLCLKNAVVPHYLAGLIDCYLVLWQVSREF